MGPRLTVHFHFVLSSESLSHGSISARPSCCPQPLLPPRGRKCQMWHIPEVLTLPLREAQPVRCGLSGTQPSDLVPFPASLPRGRAHHLGRGCLRTNPRSWSPSNCLQTAMCIRVYPRAHSAKVKEHYGCCPHALPVHQVLRACPRGVRGPLIHSLRRLEVGKLRLGEVTSISQGHTAPKGRG